MLRERNFPLSLLKNDLYLLATSTMHSTLVTHVDFSCFVALAKVFHQIVRGDRVEEDHVAASNHVVQEMTAAIAIHLVAALSFAP